MRSLQSQLLVRLAALFALASVVGIAAVVIEGREVARSLGAHELAERARDVARHVIRGPDGAPLLQLPPTLEERYRSPSHTRLLVIRTPDGHEVAASSAAFAAEVARHPTQSRKRRSFRLEDFGPAREDYTGITIQANSAAGPLLVSVATLSEAEELANELMESFVDEAAVAIPAFALAMFALAIWSIRRSLRPVTAVSLTAAAIGPGQTGVRLPTAGLPSELLPLVAAVNGAIDRLEQGVIVQRQFTANAAHELRTPLTILTAGLDALPDGNEVDSLREDAARMNRLVDQLLRVARLDGVTLDTSTRVDLREIAAQAVEYLSPLAVSSGRTLGFDAPAQSVWIHGNAPAIADALRNVIENALQHTRAGTEVTVTVAAEGSVSVADHGEGIAAADRERVFERFWRGPGITRRGAGLGLAIVAQTVRAHRGEVSVHEAPSGGALFVLRFVPRDQPPGSILPT